MKSIELTAKTTEDAISQGLEQLGVSISDVKVDIIEEGSKGLFGLFGSRPARIRMTLIENDTDDEVRQIFSHSLINDKKPETAPAPQPEMKKQAEPRAEKPRTEKQEKPKTEKPAPRKEAAQPAEKQEKKQPAQKPRQEAAPRQEKPAESKQERVPVEQLDRSTQAGKAQDFLQEVTRLMGLSVDVSVTTDDEGFLHADMQGDTSGVLIGRRGETLDALQYLTSLHINKGQSDYTRITLDTENYRARREDTLVRLANRYANRAVKTGRRVSVEPMNPYERRILHSALQSNDLVETHSEGEEPNRHVVITPKKNARENA